MRKRMSHKKTDLLHKTTIIITSAMQTTPPTAPPTTGAEMDKPFLFINEQDNAQTQIYYS